MQAVASVQGALLSCSYGVLGSLRVSEGARCGLGLFLVVLASRGVLAYFSRFRAFPFFKPLLAMETKSLPNIRSDQVARLLQLVSEAVARSH